MQGSGTGIRDQIGREGDPMSWKGDKTEGAGKHFAYLVDISSSASLLILVGTSFVE